MSKSQEDFEIKTDFIKIEESLNMVFGFAIICKENGEDYFDVQGDHIPEDAMLKASADFMANSRVSKDMHQGEQTGSVVFAWPLTSDIAKAMGIETKTTGLMIAIKPSLETLQKFKDGTFSGFSIGGKRVRDENV